MKQRRFSLSLSFSPSFLLLSFVWQMTPCVIITTHWSSRCCRMPKPPFGIYRASLYKRGNIKSTTILLTRLLRLCTVLCCWWWIKCSIFVTILSRLVSFEKRSTFPIFIRCNSKIKCGKVVDVEWTSSSQWTHPAPPWISAPLISCCFSWQHIRRCCQDSRPSPGYIKWKKKKTYKRDVLPPLIIYLIYLHTYYFILVWWEKSHVRDCQNV